jgi:coproporphyrinogen III oxidase-like Fe-S oxidoreductase
LRREPLRIAIAKSFQLHFGGGTPNFLSPPQLREVVERLRGTSISSPMTASIARSSSIRAASSSA